jgi:cell division protein FtsB
MDETHFEQLAQEILRQKQRMDQLEVENGELRARIADLRAGRGLMVIISGSHFAVGDNLSPGAYLAETRR